MRLVVADTGPLLHLGQVGALDLLAACGEVHLPATVLAEWRRHAPEDQRARLPEWLFLDELKPATRSQADRWIEAGSLHVGEAEALALAQELRADWFLTDDAAARLLAESLGFEAHGSLGVMLFAAAMGSLNEASVHALLHRLEGESTLWLSSRVCRAAREALARIFAR